MVDSKAEQALEKYVMQGIHPSINAVQKVLLFFGNPQDTFLSVHVAGTNGKGSTCAMLDSVFRTAGLTTGLYTSPHLVSVTERIRASGIGISDSELCYVIRTIEKVCEKTRVSLTYFEIVTIAAFLYFAQRKVDIAVVETGMGGRWDATNTLKKPLITLLTNIALDHREYLGKTLEKIAEEKFAVIKMGVPVVSAAITSGQVRKNLSRCCRQHHASLSVYTEHFMTQNISSHSTTCVQDIRFSNINGFSDMFSLNLLGLYQTINAGLAIQAVATLNHFCGMAVSPDALSQGLKNVQWPGRCQRIRWRKGTKQLTIIIDGAHNHSGIEALVETMHYLSWQPVTLIFGVLKDKDYKQMISAIAPQVRQIYTVPIMHERGLNPQVLMDEIQRQGFHSVESIYSWDVLFNTLISQKHHTIVMAGSLYLLGDFLRYMKGYTLCIH